LFRKVKTKEEEPGGKLKTKRRRSRGWIEKERGGGRAEKWRGKSFYSVWNLEGFWVGFFRREGHLFCRLKMSEISFPPPQKKKKN
jgi:hypothetical protein